MFLQIRTPDDQGTPGSVKYKNSNSEIRIELKNEIIKSQGKISRPAVVISTSMELVDNLSNGRYIITTQGAIFGDVVYVNKNGRKFRFFDDQDSYLDGSCSWTGN